MKSMSKRYGTLDVSLNMSKSGPHKTHRTIEAFTERDDEQSSKTQNDEKVNKFKELYYKNQRLRRELKSLNQKLNQKLDKLKLPSVKRKTMSVDLNHSPIKPPPSKAIVRELQNGYKQIAMYKKRVQSLKGKEETSENYQKFRNAQNMVNYMNMEIERVQQDLISIKNIRKIQEKALGEDVDNVDLKQRINDYHREIKSFKDKMKQIEKKSRKREIEFKKQQAYLVALKAKIRKDKAEQDELDKPEPEKPIEIDPLEFNQAREELRMTKIGYETSVKKVETLRVHVKRIKSQKDIFEEQFKEKEALYKLLLVNFESYARLLKDLQTKKYEQTGVREGGDEENNKILKLQEIEDGPEQSQQRIQKVWREES